MCLSSCAPHNDSSLDLETQDLIDLLGQLVEEMAPGQDMETSLALDPNSL